MPVACPPRLLWTFTLGVTKLLQVFNLLEESKLVACPVEVVGWVLYLVICVAIDVVSQEAHTLHEREECHSIGQVLLLHRGEEAVGRLKISLGESLKDVTAELHLADIRTVLGYGL